MKAIIIFINLVFFGFLTQAQPKIKYRYKKTESGLGYKYFKKGKGKKVSRLDRLYVNYNLFYKTDTGSVKTVMMNGTKDFIVGQEEVLKGWDEGFMLLKEGDSVLFKIPPHLAYGDKKVGKIPPQSTLYLQAKLQKIDEAFFPHVTTDTLKFDTGLKKILVTSSEGEKVVPFSEVRMRFTGYVYSTKGYRQIFESSKTNSAEALFQLGAGRMIKGLDEGIATMKIGEKATFIVPPKLGFGNKQAGKILPNTTLYYDVELVSCNWPFLKSENQATQLLKDSMLLSIVDKKNGDLISEEDVVTFHYKAYYKNEDGNPIICDNSFERNKPLTQRPGYGRGFPGVEEVFTYLKNGEKATVIVPYKLANSRKKNPFLKNNNAAYYDIYIENVFKYPFMKLSARDTVSLSSGLKYLYDDVGSSKEVVKGTKVKIAYCVYFYDSKGMRHILDGSRDSGKPLEMTVGDGQNIVGVEEGLLGMKTGSKKRLIIPPALGYGENGLPEKGVPAKTNLIFDIEFMEILN